MVDVALRAGEGFTIYRAEDAPGLMQAGCMSVAPFSPIQRAGMDRMLAAGFMHGEQVKVLVNIPGFSLTHVWFKKNYPLPLHSHDSDCLYYIVAGSLRLGTEELGPRDSFFVPGNVPYTYRPGPEGVELLEYRHETHFDFVNLARSAAFWDKGVAICAASRDDWEAAERPPLNV